jgi:hypothetical protein
MLVEPPHQHQAPDTLRGFLRQYAMIVLSILTALGLEQIVVSVHDASTARASRARIEAELSRLVVDLKGSVQTNKARLQAVNDAMTALDAKLKDGNPDPATVQALAQKVVDRLGVDMPSYQRAAWDAAIADHSVSNLRSADLQRYSQIYGEEQSAIDLATLMLTGEYVRRLADTRVEFRIGRLDPQALAHTLSLDAVAGEDILRQQESLIRLIESGQRTDDQSASRRG